jgi:hypothetical protein
LLGAAPRRCPGCAAGFLRQQLAIAALERTVAATMLASAQEIAALSDQGSRTLQQAVADTLVTI